MDLFREGTNVVFKKKFFRSYFNKLKLDGTAIVYGEIVKVAFRKNGIRMVTVEVVDYRENYNANKIPPKIILSDKNLFRNLIKVDGKSVLVKKTNDGIFNKKQNKKEKKWQTFLKNNPAIGSYSFKSR